MAWNERPVGRRLPALRAGFLIKRRTGWLQYYGGRLRARRSRALTPPTIGRVTYQYDALHRLTSEVRTGTGAYNISDTYDPLETG